MSKKTKSNFYKQLEPIVLRHYEIIKDKDTVFYLHINKVVENLLKVIPSFYYNNFPKFDNLIYPINSEITNEIKLDLESLYHFDASYWSISESIYDKTPHLLSVLYEYIYEILDEDKKKKTGTYYTSQKESEFMCKLSLYKYLINRNPYHNGQPVPAFNIPNQIIYDFIFHPEKECMYKEELIDRLVWCNIIDPACGCGSFIVEMVRVITNITKQYNTGWNIYQQITGWISGVYGIDIDKQALHVTKLRLFFFWLSNGSEKQWSEFSKNEDSQHFCDNLNLYESDAIIIEKEGINYNLLGLPKSNTVHSFLETLDNSIENWNDSFILNLKQIKDSYNPVIDNSTTPFTWHNTCSYIFKNYKGFDIVIGNPPYVNANLMKKEYKEKLKYTTKTFFRKFFKNRDIDNRSDLCLYFYFLSLALVNEKGIVCLLTSNGWLEANYGGVLQDFLFSHTDVQYVFGLEHNRSFDYADINTNITLVQNVNEEEDRKNNEFNFVLFNVDYDNLLQNDDSLRDLLIENKENKNYKLLKTKQLDIWKEGCK